MIRPDTVVGWVEARHPYRLNDNTRAVIRALVSAPAGRDVKGALADAWINPVTARNRLAKKHLPRPSAWRNLGRGLRIYEALQATPNALPGEIASRLGCDRTALYHTTERTFGVPLATVAEYHPAQLVALWWARQEVAVHA